MGALTLLALSVEGWTAALMMISGGLSYALIRTAPAFAQTIRELGFAFVDVRIKYRRELESIRTEMEELRREALERDARVESEAMAKAREVEAESAQKRHDLADKLQAAMLAQEVEIGRLNRKLGVTDLRDVDAINTVSDSVQLIAEKSHFPLPVPLPHLDPIPPDDVDPRGDKP